MISNNQRSKAEEKRPKTKGIYRTLVFFVLAVCFFTPTLSAFDEEQFLVDYYWKKVIALKPPQRPRIALVLGGGGARGLAHIGVIKVFEEENIPVDIVVGTSVGAIIGSLYSAGVSIDKIENMSQSIGWDKLVNVSGPALVKMLIANQLLSTDRMEKYLSDNIGNARFENLNKTFACVAADIITGERVVLREGDVSLCVRASATMPGVFEPVEYRQRFLVDGGIVDNVPCDVAKLLGADFVIGVSVEGDFSRNKINNVFMIMAQSLYIQGKYLDESSLKDADVMIKPDVGDVSTVDLGRFDDCIKAGISSTHQQVMKIKKMIIEKIAREYLFK